MIPIIVIAGEVDQGVQQRLTRRHHAGSRRRPAITMGILISPSFRPRPQPLLPDRRFLRAPRLISAETKLTSPTNEMAIRTCC